MVKQFKFAFKRVVFHPALLALILAFLFESNQVEFQNVIGLQEGHIANLIGLFFIYGVAFIVAIGIYKLFSTNELRSEADLRAAVDELILDAGEFLFLVSPYLDPGNVLVESILEAKRRDVRVVLIYNSRQYIKPKVNEELNRLIKGGVEVYSHPRLHSKLYVNERSSIISSLNLVSRSYTDSFEVGFVTTARGIRQDSLEYIHRVILNSDHCNRTEVGDLPPLQGFCIKSGQKIEFNKNKPISLSEWRVHKGDDSGKYCHQCGAEVETTVTQPFCANCQELQSLQSSV